MCGDRHTHGQKHVVVVLFETTRPLAARETRGRFLVIRQPYLMLHFSALLLVSTFYVDWHGSLAFFSLPQTLCTILFYSHCRLLLTGGPKVYDVTKYLDDHPGGAEVMLDVAGQDADEFFEDIGHSKEAREELKKYLIGSLKIDEATKKKMEEEKAKKAAAKAGGFPVIPLVGIVLAVAAYLYVSSQSKSAESE